ncbi:MAG TPA: nucleotide exchange factor GrpE [Clostridiales bacterium]|nr:nucleotide exchange factor GrpE [Clostridiales bacterium]
MPDKEKIAQNEEQTPDMAAAEAAQAAEEVQKADVAQAAEAQMAEEAQTAETAGETTAIDSTAELEALKAQLASEKENYLRLAAEYDNYRKRSNREKEALLSEAFAMAVSAFLPLIDNIERAVSYSDSNPESVREGVLLMEKQMRDITEKINLEEINPLNAPFDPTLHEAVMHVEDENIGENTVVEVFQKGWRLGDKIVRHAMVKVAN